MAPRWLNSHLPLSGPAAITTEKDAEAVQLAVNRLQAENDIRLYALADMIVTIEIDLYDALHPPTGGTRLRLAA